MSKSPKKCSNELVTQLSARESEILKRVGRSKEFASQKSESFFISGLVTHIRLVLYVCGSWSLGAFFSSGPGPGGSG